MAYTTGVTTKGIGPSGGLLEAVVAFVTDKAGTVATAESIGTPDGVLVTFSGTVSNSDLLLENFVVDYVIGTVALQATTDALGAITGTNVDSGSITEAGVYTITFTVAPDNSSALTADYTYDYIAGRDWLLRIDQNSKNSGHEDTVWVADTREVVLSNTGLGGQDNVIIGMREWKKPSNDAFGWNLNGYSSVPAGTDWNESISEHGMSVYESTSDNWADLPTLQMFDGIIAYWIYTNKQRIIVQIRCASDYYCCYLGLGERFDPPGEYPNPLIIAGTCCGAKPYTDNACISYSDGGWSPVRSYYQYNDTTYGPDVRGRSPMMVIQANGQFQSMYNQQRHIPYDGILGYDFGTGNYTTAAINDNVVIDGAADGSYMILPSYLVMPDGSEIGFDGIRILRKNNITSEDTRTDSATGDVWRLFQSGSNTAPSAWHAIKEE